MSIEPLRTRKHTIGNGIQKFYRFANGFGASVVRFSSPFGGSGSYGSEEGKWELAVVRWIDEQRFDIVYDTPITDDVVGWLSESQVLEILERIRDLPAIQSAEEDTA